MARQTSGLIEGGRVSQRPGVRQNLAEFREIPHGHPVQARPHRHADAGVPEVQATDHGDRLLVLLRPTNRIPLHPEGPPEFQQQLLARHGVI